MEERIDSKEAIQKCLSCTKDECTNCLAYNHVRKVKRTYNIHGKELTTLDIERDCGVSYSTFNSLRYRRKLSTEETYDLYTKRKGWRFAQQGEPGMEDVGRDFPISQEVVQPTE